MKAISLFDEKLPWVQTGTKKKKKGEKNRFTTRWRAFDSKSHRHRSVETEREWCRNKTVHIDTIKHDKVKRVQENGLISNESREQDINDGEFYMKLFKTYVFILWVLTVSRRTDISMLQQIGLPRAFLFYAWIVNTCHPEISRDTTVN